jgi:hypothetical protein
MAIDEKLIDKRIVKRSVRKGLLSQEQVHEYLKALPDKSNLIEGATGGDVGDRGPSGTLG